MKKSSEFNYKYFIIEMTSDGYSKKLKINNEKMDFKELSHLVE